jgi:hypothetical protein
MLDSRIRPRCQAYMKGLFLNRPGTVRPTDHIERAAHRHGITDLRILKTRRDRVIASGAHREWGKVALKATDPVYTSIPAHSGFHTDGLVAAHPSPFLPTMHAFGLGYSVSEWIDGQLIRDMDRSECEDVPLTDFVDALRVWCSRHSEQRPLETHEVLSIVRFYVETTVRRMSYRSAWNCVRACARFRREEQRLGGYVDEMVSLAPELGLDATLMFSDVQMGNVVFNKHENRLVLIDFEALRPGNFRFDVVFWLSSMMLHRLPRPLLDNLASHVFAGDLMYSSVCSRFFRNFAMYVTETYMTIDGHDQAEIERILEVLQAAAGRAG